MKKLWLLAGVLIGFVLGSCAGRDPYEQLESKTREMAGRPDVKRAVEAAAHKVSHLADSAKTTAASKIGVTHGISPKTWSNATPTPAEPTQDPQDKAFGAAVSRDQDIVDELAKKGVREDQLSDVPTQQPRAGGKAQPA